jgi:hypothetical protein
MARTRAITKVELVQALVSGQHGWVQAHWWRADGSHGAVTAMFRPRTAERWYIARLLVDVPSAELLRDVPLARIEHAVHADPEILEWVARGQEPALVEQMKREALQRPRLARPTAHRLDDPFYSEVAEAYKGAVQAGLQPAKTLAEDADTPQGTVNRWIAAARARGFLPPGAPGKITV